MVGPLLAFFFNPLRVSESVDRGTWTSNGRLKTYYTYCTYRTAGTVVPKFTSPSLPNSLHLRRP